MAFRQFGAFRQLGLSAHQWGRFKRLADTFRKSLHTSRKNFADDNKPKKDNKLCDDGTCPRHQMDMKQMLERKEMEHLQPSRSKFVINTFGISRPHVDPVVNPELEELCLQKKRCEDMKKGTNADGKNGKTGKGKK